MTVTDQIKILVRKIKQNEAHYDLDRKAAKISALSSGNLDKYIWLVKIYIINQVLLDKLNLIILHWINFLTKDWKKTKQEGLLKRLKNTKDKMEERLRIIVNKTDVR